MPISLLYEFDETEEKAIIKVNLKGASRSGLSVIIADAYVKVNCPPHHFLELDLLDDIVLDDTSRLYKMESQHTLVLNLTKKEKRIWGKAFIDESHPKEQVEKRRMESLSRLDILEAEEREKRKKDKHLEERRLLEKQWEEDKKKRDEIERKKQEEKDQASKELSAFKKSDVTAPEVTKTKLIEAKPSKPVKSAIIEDVTFEDNDDVPEDETKLKFQECPEPIRNVTTQTIKLSFTPRAFRTPAREDKDSDTLKKYEIWKRKNKEGINELEENVMWVMERGEKFFKKGNFTSAISAFSEALKMDSSMVSCLVKRAACYLERKEYLKVIEDCTKFLATEANSRHEMDEKIVSESLYLRTRANEEVGEFKNALEDIKLAYKIEPNNMEYQKILKTLESKLSVNEEEVPKDKAEKLKDQADMEYFEQRFDNAINLYTEAINLKANFFKAYSNRAACYLQVRKYYNCIQDCTFILENVYNAKLQESEKKQTSTWVLKSYTRRGTCYYSVGDFQKAYKDYEQASRMSPDDEDILNDLEKVNKELTSQLQADWFKNTANNFYKNQDYSSAIHSYSLAIEKDKTNPVFYSNRAQCYLKMGDYVNCVKDCNLALSVLSDEDEQKVDQILHDEKHGIDRNPNQKEKEQFPTNPKLTPQLQMKVYLKRAIAYREMEELERAYLDIRRAKHVEPENKEIRAEFDKIEQMYREWRKENGKSDQPVTTSIIEQPIH